MSKLGFYGWIREGVRRAVLLGVSDAVEQLGALGEQEELHPQLAAVLRHAQPRLSQATSAERAGHGSRRRLGRTLGTLVQAGGETSPTATASRETPPIPGQ